MKFVLKQYDTELISFDLRSEGLDGFVYTILKKTEKNRRLFPLGLDLTDKGLLNWLKSRVIPINRNYNLAAKPLKSQETFLQPPIKLLNTVHAAKYSFSYSEHTTL